MAKKSNKRDLYEISGDSIKRKNRQCPRCGPGIFMAEHSDRSSCGKCGYTETKNKETEQKPEQKEEPKEEKKEGSKEEPKQEQKEEKKEEKASKAKEKEEKEKVEPKEKEEKSD